MGWAPGWEETVSTEMVDTILAYLAHREAERKSAERKAESARSRERR